MTSRAHDQRTPRNHVVLIAAEAYEGAPLQGCVNDSLAMAQLLKSRFGVGEAEITRLWSPASGRDLSAIRTDNRASAAAIRAALEQLASDAVGPEDRVVIHFSGHGGTQALAGARRRSIESLLPVDFADPGCVIHDIEVNHYLGAISEKTDNLTLILDCCHAAGASRGEHALRTRSLVLPALDPTQAQTIFAGVAALGAEDRGWGVGRGLPGQALVLAACLADEFAGETRLDGQIMGLLTHALVSRIEGLADQSQGCSWRELLPSLLAALEPQQHPCIHGDDTRALFEVDGGRRPGEVWVVPRGSTYEVAAGTLVDIGVDTLIDVYANESTHDRAIGSLRVSQATRARARAEALAPFEWPTRPRCQVAQYGATRLVVAVAGELPADVRADAEGAGIELVAADASADVRLVDDRGQWVLCDEYYGLATEGRPEWPRFDTARVAAVLSHCAAYRAPLRLALRSTDLPGALGVRLLDEHGANRSVNPLDPSGPDLAGPQHPRYRVPFDHEFCIEVTNHASDTLHLTLLSVQAAGQVFWVSHATLRGGESKAFWYGDKVGEPFTFKSPDGSGSTIVNRLVAIGTTRDDVDLHGLSLGHGFAEVIATNPRQLGPRFRPRPPRWTSALVAIESFAPSAPGSAVLGPCSQATVGP